MSQYISNNRISDGRFIPQPPAPGIKVVPPAAFSDKIVQPPSPAELRSKIGNTDLDYNVALGVAHAYVSKWAVLPEITTVPNRSSIDNLAVVVGHTGRDQARYAANARAIERLMHANPKPRYFIFVEFVNPGETSHYENLEQQGWDKVIVVHTTEKGKNVWQKEAIWTVGAKYAFNLPGITKCIFLDADTAYHDNSWCHYISEALNKDQIVQAFEAFYYAEQPDCTDIWYGPRHVSVSTAWASAHGGERHASNNRSVPGGSYACTKEFFYNVLGGKWPYSSRGSGDAVLWLFLKGIVNTTSFPMHCDYRASDITGSFSTNVGYAPLLAFHYYHGPLYNRMYGSRDYLLRKTNTYPGSDVLPNKDGVLEWTDTYEGRFMNQATDILVRLNSQVQQLHRPVMVTEIKNATRELRKDIYGRIDNTHPLYIVTYADESITDSQIVSLKTGLTKWCKTNFTFIVFTNRNIPTIQNCQFCNIPTSDCTTIWRRLLAFSYKYNPDTSVLFIDPHTVVRSEFHINQCPDGYIYMARPMVLSKTFGYSNWDSSLIFFRNIPGLYERYLHDIEGGSDTHPEYQFMNPGDYINAYAHFNGHTCRNIIGQVDYCYDKQTFYENLIQVAEFVIKDK